MKKVHFVLGVHNHQPIGNFSEVFVTASEKAYKPWIKTMVKHPEIKWNLHASGILWDWIRENYTSYIQDVDNLIKKGSLELLTGGYYEPILPVLPDVDKIGQIRKLSKYIEEEFSFSPKGMWLAERVWEPHLPAVLNKAGVQYTVLDDRHFLEAGMRDDELNGYFVTEEQGNILYVFPISQPLRYLVPFAPPEEAIAYLKSKAVEGGDSVVVLADDGEKFGLWPGTFDKVYTSGWLDRFIELLNENADWLITCTFSDVLRKFPPRSRLFIPSASYLEMSEWALPVATGTEFNNAQNTQAADGIKRFLKGGFWRNFFIRYPESNDMHKKMLFVSDKLQKALTKEKTSTQKQHLYNAQDHLWAGQCNCAYWHGVFGGIYLPHLRNAVYEQLITAEKLLKNGSEGYTHEIIDFRKSGRQEILISGDEQNLYFSPAEGGTLFEWDAVKHGINLINVMTRRQEVYHQKVIAGNSGHETAQIKSIHDMAVCKEEGLEKHLQYDWYRKVCFIDHFFHPSTTWEKFRTCAYGEQGDFITAEYKWKVHSIDNGICISLMREGRVWVDDVHHPVLVKKKIILKNYPGAEIYYTLKNNGDEKLRLWFGYEMNFLFSQKNAHDSADQQGISTLEREDKWYGFRTSFSFASACDLWSFPIETVSSAEDGFEKTYQGTSVVPHWKIDLEPGASVDLPAAIRIHEHERVYA